MTLKIKEYSYPLLLNGAFLRIFNLGEVMSDQNWLQRKRKRKRNKKKISDIIYALLYYCYNIIYSNSFIDNICIMLDVDNHSVDNNLVKHSPGVMKILSFSICIE